MTRHADRWPRWVPRTSPKHGRGIGMPVQHAGFLVRRLDRSSSPTALFAPRHLRAGQAAAAAPAAGVATFLLPRYASPVAIMAHTMRAISLARATAPRSAPPITASQTDRKGDSLCGLRSSKASSQAEAVLSSPWHKGSPPSRRPPATAAAACCRPGWCRRARCLPRRPTCHWARYFSPRPTAGTSRTSCRAWPNSGWSGMVDHGRKPRRCPCGG